MRFDAPSITAEHVIVPASPYGQVRVFGLPAFSLPIPEMWLPASTNNHREGIARFETFLLKMYSQFLLGHSTLLGVNTAFWPAVPRYQPGFK